MEKSILFFFLTGSLLFSSNGSTHVIHARMRKHLFVHFEGIVFLRFCFFGFRFILLLLNGKFHCIPFVLFVSFSSSAILFLFVVIHFFFFLSFFDGVSFLIWCLIRSLFSFSLWFFLFSLNFHCYFWKNFFLTFFPFIFVRSFVRLFLPSFLRFVFLIYFLYLILLFTL